MPEPTSRRQWIATLAVAGLTGPFALWAFGDHGSPRPAGPFRVTHTDEEWRALLSRAAYRVLREGKTERPFSSPLATASGPATFGCAGCAQPVFESAARFESETGWPSFWRPIDGSVATMVDRGLLYVRLEVHCTGCGGHLGHVFQDGPAPTGLRYCINGVALCVLEA